MLLEVRREGRGNRREEENGMGVELSGTI